MNKEKCILFSCKDGSAYALPLRLVAHTRATYYSEMDKNTTYEAEFKLVMDDPAEGIDWFRNQHDPDEFEEKDYIQVREAKEPSLVELIKDSEASVTEIDTTPASTDVQFEAAQTQVARAYLSAALQLLYFQGHGEFTSLKKPIETPDGGIYLLQIQHVTGPKIDVQKLVGGK